MERPRDLTIQVDEDTQLRLVREEDAEEYLALIQSDREHLRAFMDWVDTIHNVEYELAFINARLEEYDRGAGVQFAVVHRGRVVGATGTMSLDRVNEVAEIGYFVASTHQGRGMMTRAVGALVDHLFRVEGMHRVYARVLTTNRRSRALAGRLGLRLEGVHREEYKLRGEHHDVEVHSILIQEWEALRG